MEIKRDIKVEDVPIDQLHKIHSKDINWEKLEKDEDCKPPIGIWYDKIGTEIHFDDGSMFCRDFGGDDSKHFFILIWLIANHRWKDAVKCLEEYFING